MRNIKYVRGLFIFAHKIEQDSTNFIMNCHFSNVSGRFDALLDFNHDNNTIMHRKYADVLTKIYNFE